MPDQTTPPGVDRSAERLTNLYTVSIVFAPLIALLVVAALTMADIRTRIEAIEVQRLLTKASANANALITELQRERGTSSGFLSSGGSAFDQALDARRRQTDLAATQALAELDLLGIDAVTGDDGDRLSGAIDQVQVAIATVRETLNDLPALRARVDALAIDRPEMMTFYTEIIGDLLSISDVTAIAGAVGERDRLGVIVGLLEASTELAGQERASGASGFGSGSFDTARLAEMARLQAGQQTLQERFLRVASRGVADELQAILNGPAQRNLEELRSLARLQRTDGVTGAQWFATSTDALDRLGAFASELRQRQIGLVNESRAELTARHRSMLYLIVAVLALSILVSIWQARSLNAPIRALAENLDRLGRGDTDVEVQGAARRDLVGSLARSVRHIIHRETQRFNDALRHAPFPTTIESEDGAWRVHNLAMMRFLGIDGTDRADDRVPPGLTDFAVEEDAPLAELDGASEAGDGRTPSVEIRFRRPDGSTRIGQMTRSMIDRGASAPDVVITQIQDVTEAKHLETVQSNFVSTVSHELRTPLTSVRGSISMIKGRQKGAGDPMEARLLDIAESNCERLLKLINDLLDMDRLAQGEIRIKLERVEIGALCDAVVNDMVPYARGLDVDVVCDTQASPLYSRTDSARFSQILTNLVSNAVKFTAPGTTVRVALEASGSEVRVTVADSGPGIGPDFAPHVFDRFRQEDSSTSRTYSGSGIGLNICKEVVHHLGGTIGFRNAETGGAVFWFTVPMMGVQAPAATASASPDDGPPNRPRILHVEDDPAFSEVFSLACGTRADVVTVRSFREAIARLDQGGIDLLLIDLELPDGSGLDLLDHEAVTGSTLPVVSLSCTADTVQSSRTHLDIVKSGLPIDRVVDLVLKVLAEQQRLRMSLDDDVRRSG